MSGGRNLSRRVLIFVDRFSVGGAERQVYLLAKYLKIAGHDVQVWGFDAGGGESPMRDALARLGIPSRTVERSICWAWRKVGRRHGWVYSVSALLEFLGEWRRNRERVPVARFDWAIPFTPDPGLYLSLYRDRIASKTLVWNHRGGEDAGGFPYNGMLAWMGRLRLDGWVANSRLGAAYMANCFGVPYDKVRFMPNIFEPPPDSGAQRPRQGSGETLIVHVANIYPEKDPETLIRAFALVASHARRPRLILIGRWPDAEQREKAWQLCVDLGIDERVRLVGELQASEVSDLLGRATVGVLSSRSEGCPNAILEYMGHALPVVATRIPAIEDMLPGEARPGLFAVGDHAACASALRSLLEAPDRADALGRLNRRRVEEFYDGEAVVRRWSDYLEGLAGGGRMRRAMTRWGGLMRLHAPALGPRP